MIVRTGARIIDYGPTPAPKKAKGSIAGSIVVPPPSRYRERTPEYVAKWNAARATTRAGRRAS
jgi:hypothetical protein